MLCKKEPRSHIRNGNHRIPEENLSHLHTPSCKYAACASSVQMLVNMLKQKGGIQDAYMSETHAQICTRYALS